MRNTGTTANADCQRKRERPRLQEDRQCKHQPQAERSIAILRHRPALAGTIETNGDGFQARSGPGDAMLGRLTRGDSFLQLGFDLGFRAFGVAVADLLQTAHARLPGRRASEGGVAQTHYDKGPYRNQHELDHDRAPVFIRPNSPGPTKRIRACAALSTTVRPLPSPCPSCRPASARNRRGATSSPNHFWHRLLRPRRPDRPAPRCVRQSP